MFDKTAKDGFYYNRAGECISQNEWMAYIVNSTRDELERERRVAETTIGKYWVSTIFTNLNMSLSLRGMKDAPLIFETMVFDVDDHFPAWDLDMMDRYSTEQQAIDGHNNVVNAIKTMMEVGNVEATRTGTEPVRPVGED